MLYGQFVDWKMKNEWKRKRKILKHKHLNQNQFEWENSKWLEDQDLKLGLNFLLNQSLWCHKTLILLSFFSLVVSKKKKRENHGTKEKKVSKQTWLHGPPSFFCWGCLIAEISNVVPFENVWAGTSIDAAGIPSVVNNSSLNPCSSCSFVTVVCTPSICITFEQQQK